MRCSATDAPFVVPRRRCCQPLPRRASGSATVRRHSGSTRTSRPAGRVSATAIRPLAQDYDDFKRLYEEAPVSLRRRRRRGRPATDDDAVLAACGRPRRARSVGTSERARPGRRCGRARLRRARRRHPRRSTHSSRSALASPRRTSCRPERRRRRSRRSTICGRSYASTAPARLSPLGGGCTHRRGRPSPPRRTSAGSRGCRVPTSLVRAGRRGDRRQDRPSTCHRARTSSARSTGPCAP